MIDPNKNRIPDDVKNVHLIAVCGTAMAALACMLKELGYAVTGSDRNVYPPMSDLLAQNQIPVARGFAAENLDNRPDLVVVGNAVSKDNAEVVRLAEAGLAYCSMPQAIQHFAAKDREVLLVCGTHGKTTASSLLAWMLYSAGLDPSFVIGGVVKDFGGNYRLGKGRHMVIEGDEYDTAFFDKRSKFFHYRPKVAILTGVEFDHADIFADFGAVRKTFDKFIGGLLPESLLLAFDSDPVVRDLVKGRACNVKMYGNRDDSAWRLGRVTLQPPASVVEMICGDAVFGTFETRLIGRYNLLNALAAAAAAHSVGVPAEEIKKALATFSGVRRRQEVRGVVRGVTVMDDFAHHPTAVAATIAGVRPFYPEGRLIAVFEPRTNTSMRNVFQQDYAKAFDLADMVCVSRVPLPEKVPEGMRFSSQQLADDLIKSGKEAYCFDGADAIVDFLKGRAAAGDVVLVMSNGGFDNIHEKLLVGL
ncbi:UDP-N-acetylmuramate:L-alanyl-gamma-D-glutamyl-meso-diaminopimelate ligase [Desulfosudis oleivorans]|uniref:UDP-N-acetylmuramate n=1 Tax=Desulfosudis oleivorans (strain DSM 6200 / JCM 39069 / Hxd3) TaxID=96561 RepID=A8ZWS3_DESOH|nr:UDP-N-acetylmuramate:L-alanyl-gamma-D-glutamyl-meso-diaminopimelate ligase [Desulfosudis oleivorans]ABW68404.1 UDP-N-acetylmuramate [Desulfosudis oleivorans Hxd3]